MCHNVCTFQPSRAEMPYNLDHSSLQALLDALGPDSSEAAAAYESMRERLIRFFRWNHCLFCEDLADRALDRLATKLAASHEAVLNPSSFLSGIARMILHEQHALVQRERQLASWLKWAGESRNQTGEVSHERHEALEHCLERFTSDNRSLLERYYTGEADMRIKNRQMLAHELGVGLNALRNRALRLRRQLERCMSNYLDKRDGRDNSSPSVTHKDKRFG